jgi:hypothetical protein
MSFSALVHLLSLLSMDSLMVWLPICRTQREEQVPNRHTQWFTQPPSW